MANTAVITTVDGSGITAPVIVSVPLANDKLVATPPTFGSPLEPTAPNDAAAFLFRP